MRVTRPSSEDEMVARFLRGELESDRFAPGIRAAIDEQRLLEPDLADEAENAQRRAAPTTVRGYDTREGLFHGLPDDIVWERAALTPEEVLRVRYIEYDYWVELSGGSRLPADAAERIRAGITAFRVPNDGFFELAAALAATLPPELILLGGAEGDELVVLEGHARVTAFALGPEALPPQLEVLLGRSARIGELSCW